MHKAINLWEDCAQTHARESLLLREQLHLESYRCTHTMTDADAAKAGLEKVTDFVEDKGVDGARASEALSALTTKDDAAAEAEKERERALAAVKVSKEDVDLVVQELDVDRAVADRELRVHGGDVVKALRALVNA